MRVLQAVAILALLAVAALAQVRASKVAKKALRMKIRFGGAGRLASVPSPGDPYACQFLGAVWVIFSAFHTPLWYYIERCCANLFFLVHVCLLQTCPSLNNAIVSTNWFPDCDSGFG